MKSIIKLLICAYNNSSDCAWIAIGVLWKKVTANWGDMKTNILCSYVFLPLLESLLTSSCWGCYEGLSLGQVLESISPALSSVSWRSSPPPVSCRKPSGTGQLPTHGHEHPGQGFKEIEEMYIGCDVGRNMSNVHVRPYILQGLRSGGNVNRRRYSMIAGNGWISRCFFNEQKIYNRVPKDSHHTAGLQNMSSAMSNFA